VVRISSSDDRNLDIELYCSRRKFCLRKEGEGERLVIVYLALEGAVLRGAGVGAIRSGDDRKPERRTNNVREPRRGRRKLDSLPFGCMHQTH
jgi:hypothetical protein